eukprot:gene3503-4003_t
MLLRNFAIWIVILYSGGFIFMYLEAEEAAKSLSPSKELLLLKEEIRKRLNNTTSSTTAADVNAMFMNLEKAMKQNGAKEPYRWDYYESCFFVGSLITTIGYGNIAPTTYGGQVFTMFFSLIGIPLTMLVLRNLTTKITNTVAKIVTYSFKLIEDSKRRVNHTGVVDVENNTPRQSIIGLRLMRRLPGKNARAADTGNNVTQKQIHNKDTFSRSDKKVKVACIILLTLVVISFIFIAAMIRTASEGWSFVTSVYFWFVTITTVGFGDYLPYDGRKPNSLIKTIIYYMGAFYLLIGLALIASLITSISLLLEGRLPAVAALDKDDEADHIEDSIQPVTSVISAINRDCNIAAERRSPLTPNLSCRV